MDWLNPNWLSGKELAELDRQKTIEKLVTTWFVLTHMILWFGIPFHKMRISKLERIAQFHANLPAPKCWGSCRIETEPRYS
jgi:hypothetical protein